LAEDHQKTLKEQLKLIKEGLESDFNRRVHALKEGYLKEIKAMKE